jgi:hypothetical protein
MRYYRKIKTPTLIILAGLLALASGCHTPKHSNALIFATNTKVAFDISYDSKMQQPNITLGFTRQEGVWMPLLANRGPDGLEPAQPNGICETNKNVARPDDLYQGSDGTNADTYSVLATFKGSGAAKASGTTEMSGSIAQFFATGLAARILAEQGGAALVSTKAPTPGQTLSTNVFSSAQEKSSADIFEQYQAITNSAIKAEWDGIITNVTSYTSITNLVKQGTPADWNSVDTALKNRGLLK